MSRHTEQTALTRLAEVRTLLRKRVHADWNAIEHELQHLEAEVRLYLEADWHCTCHHGRPPACGPATITITASFQGVSMSSYPAGTPVDLLADVKDDRGNDVADQVVWATDQGTITTAPADPTNPLKAQLVNAPVGTATVTATTSNGIPQTDPIEFTDPNAGIPASISITDTAAPAAPTA